MKFFFMIFLLVMGLFGSAYAIEESSSHASLKSDSILGLDPFSEKEYLWEMYYTLNQNDAPVTEKNSKDKKEDSVPPGLIGDAFSSIARELHDEASFIKLNPKGVTADIYSELPIEWINAMSSFWQRPGHKLKRDNISELVTFFASPEFRTTLPTMLSREEKACLTYVVENNNRVTYSEMSKKFGTWRNRFAF